MHIDGIESSMIDDIVDEFYGFLIYGIDSRGQTYLSYRTETLRDCIQWVKKSYDYSKGYMTTFITGADLDIDEEARMITVTGWSYRYD